MPFHYPEPPAISPEEAKAIRTLNLKINDHRNLAQRKIGDAVVAAMAEFHASTGLHLINIDIRLIAHHNAQQIDCVILSDVHCRHQLEVL